MSVSPLLQLEHIWEKEIERENCFFQTSRFPEACLHDMEAMILSEIVAENSSAPWIHCVRMPGMCHTACSTIAQNYWACRILEKQQAIFIPARIH